MLFPSINPTALAFKPKIETTPFHTAVFPERSLSVVDSSFNQVDWVSEFVITVLSSEVHF